MKFHSSMNVARWKYGCLVVKGVECCSDKTKATNENSYKK
jgi:hypothetical protein